MRMLAQRRGWLQAFLIAFFALIVVVAIILLSLDRKLLQDQRPELQVDLWHDKSVAVAVSMLRAPVEVNGQRMPLSELIVLDQQAQENGGTGKYDDAVVKAFDDGFNGTGMAYLVVITYPDGGSLRIKNFNVPEGAEISTPTFDHALVEQLLPGTGGNIKVAINTMGRYDGDLKLESERGKGSGSTALTPPNNEQLTKPAQGITPVGFGNK